MYLGTVQVRVAQNRSAAAAAASSRAAREVWHKRTGAIVNCADQAGPVAFNDAQLARRRLNANAGRPKQESY